MSLSVYMVLAFFTLFGPIHAPPPLRLTIDCGSEDSPPPPNRGRSNLPKDFDVSSFCQLIHNAIPKAVKDGHFVLSEPENDMDQTGHSNILTPVSLPPPKGFIIPKFKTPRLRVPVLNVPTLKPKLGSTAPSVGPSNIYYDDNYLPILNNEETSAEKMEKFQKGVQKMLHVVRVLGQIDQYLSERTRIVVEKLSRTFTE